MVEEKVGKINMMFVLYQCQVWVNRTSLINLLKDQIVSNQQMLEIMGPTYGKEYVRAIESLQIIIEKIKGLDPEKGESNGSDA
jgi:hypothetical protein